jgi:hypothetical protein
MISAPSLVTFPPSVDVIVPTALLVGEVTVATADKTFDEKRMSKQEKI